MREKNRSKTGETENETKDRISWRRFIATESHLPALKSFKNVDVVAICDQNIYAAKQSALRFRIKIFFTDLEKVAEINAPERQYLVL